MTDLPLQGGVRLSAQQMAQAAAFVLAERGFRAGGLRVGIQSCDDSVARTGLFDPARCAANARAYAADPRVARRGRHAELALRGGGAAGARPRAGRAARDGLAGQLLRRADPRARPARRRASCGRSTRTGRRHFARVFPTDDRQAVALAVLARDLGAARLAALDDGDLLYGRALADRFARAGRALGRHGRGPAALGARRGGLRAARRGRGPDPARRGATSAGCSTRTARRSCAPCGGRCRRRRGSCSVTGSRRRSSWPAGGRGGGGRVRRRHAGSWTRAWARAAAPSSRTSAPRSPASRSSRPPSTPPRRPACCSTRSRARAARGPACSTPSWPPRLEDGLTGAVRFDANGDVVAPAITVLRMRRGARGPRGFPGTVLDRVVQALPRESANNS